VKLKVLYFAAVRDLVGVAEETVEVGAEVATVGALAAELTRRHPALAGRLGPVRFARNAAFADAGDALADGDEIALIPPVAGG
jgi:molybdopterin converting factor subunit 1